ncbi:MAG: choloylglycine hydrolase [Oscillospiraceae bacterium]|nr:choloylglycine hydrolase [Oscillospiraceae bacterium]
MCTSISMTTDDCYFGRNMDIAYNFGEHVTVVPRNYPFKFRLAGNMPHHFAMLGMATVRDNYPMFAEAANEKGLGAAGLNFPGNAYYPKEPPPDKGYKWAVSPFEFIPWVLGQCSTAEEAKLLIMSTCLVDIPFSEYLPLTPLHWHFADKNSSIVVEQTKDGMHVYDNPVNVLTNNPPFDFQLLNLSQYLNLSVTKPDGCFACKAGIEPFGLGMGSVGLPGDFSPASRFVKAAFILVNSKCKCDDEDSSISQFFHIMESVSVVNGSINDSGNDNENYRTTYCCCMNLCKGIYYYKTYDNSLITAVNLYGENLNGSSLTEFPCNDSLQVEFLN